MDKESLTYNFTSASLDLQQDIQPVIGKPQFPVSATLQKETLQLRSIKNLHSFTLSIQNMPSAPPTGYAI